MTVPRDSSIRLMRPTDYTAISEMCRVVYPNDAPYTAQELAEHVAVYPQGQFVAEHTPTGQAVGVHFTLRLRMADYHVDDSWDVLVSHGSFADHDPTPARPPGVDR